MVLPSAANRDSRQEQKSMKNMLNSCRIHVEFCRFRVVFCIFDAHLEEMPGWSIY